MALTQPCMGLFPPPHRLHRLLFSATHQAPGRAQAAQDAQCKACIVWRRTRVSFSDRCVPLAAGASQSWSAYGVTTRLNLSCYSTPDISDIHLNAHPATTNSGACEPLIHSTCSSCLPYRVLIVPRTPAHDWQTVAPFFLASVHGHSKMECNVAALPIKTLFSRRLDASSSDRHLRASRQPNGGPSSCLTLKLVFVSGLAQTKELVINHGVVAVLFGQHAHVVLTKEHSVTMLAQSCPLCVHTHERGRSSLSSHMRVVTRTGNPPIPISSGSDRHSFACKSGLKRKQNVPNTFGSC
jgi:hypothetical protein